MLTIRDEQMTVFKAAAWQAFQQRIVELMEARFPVRFAELGKTEVTRIAGKAIEHGRKHSFASQDDIIQLSELMTQFAPDLVEAPDYEWARDLLAQRGIESTHRLSILAYRMNAPVAPV